MVVFLVTKTRFYELGSGCTIYPSAHSHLDEELYLHTPKRLPYADQRMRPVICGCTSLTFLTPSRYHPDIGMGFVVAKIILVVLFLLPTPPRGYSCRYTGPQGKFTSRARYLSAEGGRNG